MPETFSAESSVGVILDDAEGAPILRRYLPDLLAQPYFLPLRHMPVGELVSVFGGSRLDADASKQLWADLAALGPKTPGPVSEHVESLITPRTDYEAESVERGSAEVSYPAAVERWDAFELELRGPRHANPFVDVEIAARFTRAGADVRVGGFYDGDGRYLVRFMPLSEGEWSFVTESTARSLDGIVGGFTAQRPGERNRGHVRVDGQFHFVHASGEPFVPLGTTAYAWTHQSAALQERTIETLSGAGFTKLRMCLFPKSYDFNLNEPDSFPFERTEGGTFDFARFDLSYFRNLEHRIHQLLELGIEADLILFHPYDRWGFSDLGKVVDDRFVSYVVRRLAAFRNVWWSMANEYDLLRSKSLEDWERLAGIVTDEDHVGHLISIHNWIKLYDHSRPWITHISIQSNAVDRISEWRSTWGKPVVLDECGYEGDLPYGWGNLTGEDMTRLHWEAAVRGAYVGHGETYLNPAEELWWAKGGELVGHSPERIAFLRSVVEASPTGRLEPLPSDFDLPWGGVAERYAVGYFGAHQPLYRDVQRRPGTRYHVDVIDTWNMTIERLPDVLEGSMRVELPARPYMAIRLIAVD
jgi:hypothetical protein